jgi:hypothetical protein
VASASENPSGMSETFYREVMEGFSDAHTSLSASGRREADHLRSPRLPMPGSRPQGYPPAPSGLVDGNGSVYDSIPGMPGYHQRTNIAGLPVRDTTIGGLPSVSPTMNGMPRLPARYGPGGPPITGPGGGPLYTRGRPY